MRKNFLTLIFILGCLTLSNAGWSQQRHCDLKVTLLSPSNNQEIAPYFTFDVSVRIKNLGPDSILAGDSLYYNLPIFLLTEYHAFPFSQNIAPGDSTAITLQSIMNMNENSQDEKVNFCVRIKSQPDSQGSYIDTVAYNNYSCDSIELDATTSIKNQVVAADLFSIFPNPVENNLHLQWSNTSVTATKKCIVKDLTGRTLLVVSPKAGEQQSSLAVSQLVPGMYFLDVWVNNRHAVQKFIKR